MKAFNIRAKLLTLLCLCLLATGCSSTPTGGNEDEVALLDNSESSADSVGSIPEDMLAEDGAPAEKGGSEGSPFDMLAEESAPPPSDMTVTEGGDHSSSYNPGSSATTGETGWYEVKRGDTLMKVAFSIYGDIDRWKELQDWNADALRGKALRHGMKLKYEVPAEAFSPQELSHSYLIKSGDTLAGIADDVYGRRAKYKKLQRYNPRLIKNVNRIFAGFTLYYEITEQEMAEAEARRQGRPSAPAAIPHAANQPASAPAAAAKPDVVDLTQEEAIAGPTPASK